ncbi:hypothetical protein LCGC14_0643740 [marine sediment metagenome]|uniref:Uncharacterized protein n=1 Tax=marine sediment metagenome TaxID=412755 RepID=A0A0F9U6S1_9ZZZZ|nr:DegT/DnrJ/EryC1/StrS family aminotransferase [Pricia sp.]
MIPLFKVFMPDTVFEPLKEVLTSGYIGEGEKVREFERSLIPWFDNENVLATNSCTSAIQLALRLAGVEAGDEVISTPMTCTATNMPILAIGAKIVWADIDPWTGNIDSCDVVKKVTDKTKAIICVDWGGHPCEFERLQKIADDANIKLIEDAAHAFGSFYNNKMVGSHCDFVCFSFQAVKTFTTVDGGALTCRSKEDHERGKLLRWYGIDRNEEGLRCESDIKEWGYKFHMNDVAATIGIEQIKHVAGNIAKTKFNAQKYNKAFGGMRLRLGRGSCYWLYTIRVKNRNEFMEYMKDNGIETSKVHARNDHHTCFAESRCYLPGVDEFCSEQVSIPVGWWVDTDYIIEKVKLWLHTDCR